MTEKEGGNESKANADETEGCLLPAAERKENYVSNFFKICLQYVFHQNLAY